MWISHHHRRKFIYQICKFDPTILRWIETQGGSISGHRFVFVEIQTNPFPDRPLVQKVELLQSRLGMSNGLLSNLPRLA